MHELNFRTKAVFVLKSCFVTGNFFLSIFETILSLKHKDQGAVHKNLQKEIGRVVEQSSMKWKSTSLKMMVKEKLIIQNTTWSVIQYMVLVLLWFGHVWLALVSYSLIISPLTEETMNSGAAIDSQMHKYLDKDNFCNFASTPLQLIWNESSRYFVYVQNFNFNSRGFTKI